MRRLLFVALTAGLLSPTAAIADTYDALCNNNDCQITINDSGLESPQGFIDKENIIQSAGQMGLPNNVDISILFNQMSTMVDKMKEQLDKSLFRSPL